MVHPFLQGCLPMHSENIPDDTLLVHMTSRNKLDRILSEGLNACSYWALEGEVSSYYAETIEDEGEEPVELRLPLSVLKQFGPEADRPGLDEPLTHTLRMHEDEVWEAWEESEQRWQDCLTLIQSMRCRQPIPAAALLEHNPALSPPPPKRRERGPGR